jgi:hypothetical protein
MLYEIMHIFCGQKLMVVAGFPLMNITRQTIKTYDISCLNESKYTDEDISVYVV